MKEILKQVQDDKEKPAFAKASENRSPYARASEDR